MLFDRVTVKQSNCGYGNGLVVNGSSKFKPRLYSGKICYCGYGNEHCISGNEIDIYKDFNSNNTSY